LFFPDPYGGGSPDWAKAIGNIKYSYLIELRNHHSFILPTEQIRPTGEENWAALSVISRDIILYYGDIPAPHVGDSLHWSTDNAFDEYQGDKLSMVSRNRGLSLVSQQNLVKIGVILFLFYMFKFVIDV